MSMIRWLARLRDRFQKSRGSGIRRSRGFGSAAEISAPGLEPLEPRLLLSFDGLGSLGGSFVPAEDPQDHEPSGFIAALEKDAQLDAVVEQIESRGGTVEHQYENALHGLSFSGAKLTPDDPGVRAVESDLMMRALDHQTLPTGVDRIEADRNKTASIDGSSTDVDADIAIIDTGIDKNHPDLNVAGGVNFADGPWDSWDDGNGHGTHVAGTAAASDNNGGVVGMAPGAELYAVRVLGDDGRGRLSDIIAGVDWVTDRADTIDVANMSLGAQFYSEPFHEAIYNSVNAGVFYSVAAGNESVDVYGGEDTYESNSAYSPAALPEVATVSALADSNGEPGGDGADTWAGSDDSFASFSNYSENVDSSDYNGVDTGIKSPGAAIDLMAPGVEILSTWKDGEYNTISGTSMASPHIAGLAALHYADAGTSDLNDDGNENQDDVYELRQTLIDGGVAQDSDTGLATLNDPDSNEEHIGWAEDPGPPPEDPDPTPEIGAEHEGGGIESNQNEPVDFGRVIDEGYPAPTETFTIHNTGEAELSLGEITLPEGFTLVEGLNSSLEPDGSDELEIRLDNGTVGTKSGEMEIANNDADENPFTVPLLGEVMDIEAASIGDFVWDDLNEDGVQDGGEPGVENVTVNLLDSEGNPTGRSTTTNANGHYVFANLSPGDYRVEFNDLPGSHLLTEQDAGSDDALDSDPNPLTSRTGIISVGEDEFVNSVDAGLTAETRADTLFVSSSRDNVIPSDYFFDTVTRNGETVESFEDGVSDWSGQSWAAAGPTIWNENQISDHVRDGDSSGRFRYTSNVNPNGESGGSFYRKLNDLDPLESFGFWAKKTNEPEDNINFGLAMSEKMLGDDAERDPLDRRINDAEVISFNFHRQVGEVVFVSTNSGQKFSTGFSMQDNTWYRFTIDNVDFVNGQADYQIQNSGGGVVANGQVPLASPNEAVGRTGSIGDYVWQDLDGDASQDDDEPGVSGITVNLLDENGDPTGRSTTTQNGNYRFDNLAPGRYRIEFTDLPDGTVFGEPNAGAGSDSDSDADPMTGRSGVITIRDGGRVNSLDAGLRQPMPEIVARHGGNELVDGQKEAISFGTVVQGETEPTRSFILENIGDAELTLDELTLPEGFTALDGLDGPLNPGETDTLEIRLDDDTAGSKSGTLSIANNDADENPFSFPIAGRVDSAGSIGDFVWRDEDADGVQDEGEPGVENVTVNLLDSEGNPTGRSTTTDEDGLYTIEDVTPGEYRLEFTDLPVGHVFTRQTPGVRLTQNSDVRPKTGKTGPFTLQANENWTWVDAGLRVLPAEIALEHDGTELSSGQASAVDFGTAIRGEPGPTETFTVQNEGGAALTLGTPQLPDGFTLTEGLDGELGPGGSDTFTVQLDTEATGEPGGLLSVPNNDLDEDPFGFPLAGEVTLPGSDATIDVGTHTLLADRSGQTIQIPISDSGELVDGAEFRAEIGGGESGPVFEGVDLLEGTVFEGGTQSVLSEGPRLVEHAVLTEEGEDVTPSEGGDLFATLTIDTTGVEDGEYDLKLGGIEGEGGPLNTTLAHDGAASLPTILNGTIEIVSAEIAGRHLFYDGSGFDGEEPGPSDSDDGAIAPNVEALQPGQKARLKHISNYVWGITGIMVDLENLANPDQISADDFEFRVGNSHDIGSWSAGPAPEAVAVHPGAGVDGSDRVTLTWPDEAIKNSWLEVRVKANQRTGLNEDSVFYFGNQAGDTSGDRRVNATDISGIWANLRSMMNPAPVDFPFDITKDRRVNATDISAAWSNLSGINSALKLIEPKAENTGGTVSGVMTQTEFRNEGSLTFSSEGTNALASAESLSTWDWWQRQNERQHQEDRQDRAGRGSVLAAADRNRLILDETSLSDDEERDREDETTVDALSLV